jgi:hypothetical protein
MQCDNKLFFDLKTFLTNIRFLLINPNDKFNARACCIDWWEKRNWTNIYHDIINNTNFLPENSSIRIRVYCILNDIKEQPKCKVCGNPVRFSRVNQVFNVYCSSDCVNKDSLKIQKAQQTCLEKYGVKNPNLLDITKQKIKETCQEKYGHCSYLQSKKYREERAKVPKISDKFNRDLLYTEHVVNQKPHTVIAQENGVSSALIDQLCKRYNVPTNNYCKISKEEKQIVDYIKSIYSGEVQENTRLIISPKELDIYLPERKLAIEYNGCYWHRNDKEGQLHKLEQCTQKGIKILQFFENEWLLKEEICKSIIAAHLGIFKERLYGRECQVVEIKAKEANLFLEQNHRQGVMNSSVNLALKYNNEIVAVMCFAKPRFLKSCDIELTRFCNKIYTTVIGGASKLFKYYTNKYQPKSVVSYADRRFSTGKMYNAIGFVLSHKTTSNYFYYHENDLKLMSRNKFQKHKLKKLFDDYDDNKTEFQMMEEHGFYKLFDCGNLVYIWR